MKCTPQAIAQVQALRTRYPWAVANNAQVIVAVFDYRADARTFASQDQQNLVAFDASGVMFVAAPAAACEAAQ